jgi:hypothetical protein
MRARYMPACTEPLPRPSSFETTRPERATAKGEQSLRRGRERQEATRRPEPCSHRITPGGHRDGLQGHEWHVGDVRETRGRIVEWQPVERDHHLFAPRAAQGQAGFAPRGTQRGIRQLCEQTIHASHTACARLISRQRDLTSPGRRGRLPLGAHALHW